VSSSSTRRCRPPVTYQFVGVSQPPDGPSPDRPLLAARAIVGRSDLYRRSERSVPDHHRSYPGIPILPASSTYAQSSPRLLTVARTGASSPRDAQSTLDGQPTPQPAGRGMRGPKCGILAGRRTADLAFGDAGLLRLDGEPEAERPDVGIRHPSGHGYWLWRATVASSFGDPQSTVTGAHHPKVVAWCVCNGTLLLVATVRLPGGTQVRSNQWCLRTPRSSGWPTPTRGYGYRLRTRRVTYGNASSAINGGSRSTADGGIGARRRGGYWQWRATEASSPSATPSVTARWVQSAQLANGGTRRHLELERPLSVVDGATTSREAEGTRPGGGRLPRPSGELRGIEDDESLASRWRLDDRRTQPRRRPAHRARTKTGSPGEVLGEG